MMRHNYLDFVIRFLVIFHETCAFQFKFKLKIKLMLKILGKLWIKSEQLLVVILALTMTQCAFVYCLIF